MASKSGDSSLRDWFGKSKSSDGKPGWVQLGGKYSGKPCAKQPGQTTKPKCGSSKMKRALSKDEEESAFRRKNKKDPNPNRSGKAINVKTEETIIERGDHWNPDPEKDRKLGGPGANARAREDRAAASKPKEDPKKLKKGESYMDYSKRQKASKQKSGTAASRLNKMGANIKPKERKRDKIGRALGNAIDRVAGIKKEEVQLEGKGEKDACYHKVKSRYSVWPSAYASGALVKCRKKGAKNWGNSTKKEGFSPAQIRAMESIGVIELDEAGKKCWKGYKKAGTQKLFGKTYNRCVKENDHGQDLEHQDNSSINEAATRIPTQNGQTIVVYLNFRGKPLMMQVFFPQMKLPKRSEVQDAVQKVYPGGLLQTYYPSMKDPTKPTFMMNVGESMEPKDIQLQKQQIMLNVKKTQQAKKRLSTSMKKGDDSQVQQQEAAAWTRSAGKNKEGGLNEKGRKSYERENPGSDLKAPSKKKGNKRRASFCARMKGMKAKLTSAKTARDPDSRINKSLRAWNC